MRLRVIAGYALSIGLMLGATVCIVGYFANGIAYSDLFGLRGREQDAHVAGARALYFLSGVIGFQIAAGASTASLLSRRPGVSRGAIARFIIGLAISTVGTALFFLIVVQVNRVLQLI